MNVCKWIVLFLFFWIINCHSEVYKWTDNNGLIHFSDQPNNSPNVEEIKTIEGNSSYENPSDPLTDETIVEYMDNLKEKVQEIKKEADECYYIAINKKELDISCKNYRTLLNRDFKPLIKELKNYISDNPKLKFSKKELDELREQAKEADEIAKEANQNFLQAIDYIVNVLYEMAKNLKQEAYSCYSYAIENKASNINCQNYELIRNKEFYPLIEKVKNFIQDNTELDITKKEKALTELNNLILEAEDDYKRAMVYIDSNGGR